MDPFIFEILYTGMKAIGRISVMGRTHIIAIILPVLFKNIAFSFYYSMLPGRCIAETAYRSLYEYLFYTVFYLF